jgi:hypothetical protein
LRKVLAKHFQGPIHKLCAGQRNNYNNAEASGGLNTSIESMFYRQNKLQISSWKQKCEALYFIIRHHIPPSRHAPAFDKLFTYMRTPGYDLFKAKNATYNSAYFYRELIQLIAVVLSEDIKKDVQKCNAYSIIVDETEDRSSHKSQLAVLIRFFNVRTRCADIRLLGIIPVKKKTGENVYKMICKLLDVYGIPPSKMFGFGSDGASAMMHSNNKPDNKAVSARLLRCIPWLSFHHCLAHKLNLAIKDASKNVPFIEDKFIENLSKTFFYFANSPNMTSVWDDTHRKIIECGINESLMNENGKQSASKITHGTPTRFLSLTAAISSIIDTMGGNLIIWKFNSTSTKQSPEKRLSSQALFEFWSTWQSLKCLFFMAEVHHLLAQLARYLQTSSILFTEAYSGINLIIDQVQKWAHVQPAAGGSQFVDDNMIHQPMFEQKLQMMKSMWQQLGYNIHIQNPRLRTYKRVISRSELFERQQLQTKLRQLAINTRNEEEKSRLEAVVLATTESIENTRASSQSGRNYRISNTKMQQAVSEQLAAEAQIYAQLKSRTQKQVGNKNGKKIQRTKAASKKIKNGKKIENSLRSKKAAKKRKRSSHNKNNQSDSDDDEQQEEEEEDDDDDANDHDN